MSRDLMMPSEIAALLDYDEQEFIDDISSTGHPARRAYKRGMAATSREVRTGIIDAAAAGSPHSIMECQRLILRAMSEIQ